ncbi:MAG: glycosyltransferase [Treponema sp.]|nr:glycosyltransferase [Treponema sp.]
MACRNGEKFIAKQIQSILSQLGENDELIISDDQSTDNTVAIIESFKDERIKLFKHEPPSIKAKLGRSFYFATANFENALKHASGDIIFLSDHDDIWTDGKVKECLKALDACDFVQTNFSLINDKDEITNTKFLDFNPIGSGLVKTLWICKMQGCTMAFNRKVLEKALPFPKHLMLHDAWLGLIAKKYFKVGYIDKPLLLYRRTGTNVSTSSGESKNPLWFRIYFRLKIFFQLLFR